MDFEYHKDYGHFQIYFHAGSLLKNQNPMTPKKTIPTIVDLLYSCSSINHRHIY